MLLFHVHYWCVFNCVCLYIDNVNELEKLFNKIKSCFEPGWFIWQDLQNDWKRVYNKFYLYSKTYGNADSSSINHLFIKEYSHNSINKFELNIEDCKV